MKFLLHLWPLIKQTLPHGASLTPPIQPLNAGCEARMQRVLFSGDLVWPDWWVKHTIRMSQLDNNPIALNYLRQLRLIHEYLMMQLHLPLTSCLSGRTCITGVTEENLHTSCTLFFLVHFFFGWDWEVLVYTCVYICVCVFLFPSAFIHIRCKLVLITSSLHNT